MLASLNGPTEVKKVKFTPFENRGQTSSQLDYEILKHLKIHMTVELANTSMTLKEVLGLNEGSVISLEKLAGEPVDIRLDGEVFAKGEVVIINEVFGIRVGSLVTDKNA
ncbi:FliM/FliN family flagellar motor switch protein [Desulfitibacter alkalitolerans]|uniref:FliM/FliN family flagellar motor switch protein n=1 Tax=Desulfitibacter alkalitolerans TaxID=264641 RepID=UPI000684C303|nr:FliM/FliN family flagellar motor switch protein [Desulfitibacter alkalitolerans]